MPEETLLPINSKQWFKEVSSKRDVLHTMMEGFADMLRRIQKEASLMLQLERSRSQSSQQGKRWLGASSTPFSSQAMTKNLSQQTQLSIRIHLGDAKFFPPVAFTALFVYQCPHNQQKLASDKACLLMK